MQHLSNGAAVGDIVIEQALQHGHKCRVVGDLQQMVPLGLQVVVLQHGQTFSVNQVALGL